MGIDKLIYPNKAAGLDLCRRLDMAISFLGTQASGSSEGQITLRYLECLLVYNADGAAK